jgi:hypothetical protein
VLSSLLTLAGSAAIAWLLIRHGYLHRLQALEHRHTRPQKQGGQGRGAGQVGTAGRNVHIRWGGRRRRSPPAQRSSSSPHGCETAPRPYDCAPGRCHSLDESLDDLRAKSPITRAIIAAYAHGAGAREGRDARLPAEAPLEYLVRSRDLDTSASP